MTNQFIASGLYNHDAQTWNGAVSHSTSGSPLLDYFAKMGSYRNRTLQEVYGDIAAAFAENPLGTVQAIIYNRMITRKTYVFGGYTEATQRGQGNRDESRKAFGWLLRYHPQIAKANLPLFIAAGVVKDLWHKDLIDIVNWQDAYAIMVDEDIVSRGLLAKYLPRIRSYSNVKNEYHIKLNDFARGFCDYVDWDERDYRHFKSDPANTAHLWQRQMSTGQWRNIDFSMIPGKALFNAVTQKGRDKQTWLQRHNLEDKYLAWLESQPVAKFTGYPHELFVAAFRVRWRGHKMPSRVQAMTYDKQFEGLVAKGLSENGGIQGNVWCALDTSGSMGTFVDGGKTTAYDVCVALGIYFSALNQGAFKNHVIMFDNTSRSLELRGTFTEKAQQIISHATAWGSTNFQSVIEEIVRIRRDNPGIPVADYPQTLLVVSDMQFNPSGYRGTTNYEQAMTHLAAVGLPPINIIWWQVNGRFTKDVPNKLSDRGVTMLSGFDGATISLVLGGSVKAQKPLNEMTPYEQMVVVLDQELLNLVRVW